MTPVPIQPTRVVLGEIAEVPAVTLSLLSFELPAMFRSFQDFLDQDRLTQSTGLGQQLNQVIR